MCLYLCAYLIGLVLCLGYDGSFATYQRSAARIQTLRFGARTRIPISGVRGECEGSQPSARCHVGEEFGRFCGAARYVTLDIAHSARHNFYLII